MSDKSKSLSIRIIFFYIENPCFLNGPRLRFERPGRPLKVEFRAISGDFKLQQNSASVKSQIKNVDKKAFEMFRAGKNWWGVCDLSKVFIFTESYKILCKRTSKSSNLLLQISSAFFIIRWSEFWLIEACRLKPFISHWLGIFKRETIMHQTLIYEWKFFKISLSEFRDKKELLSTKRFRKWFVSCGFLSLGTANYGFTTGFNYSQRLGKVGVELCFRWWNRDKQFSSIQKGFNFCAFSKWLQLIVFWVNQWKDRILSMLCFHWWSSLLLILTCY